MKSQHQHSNLSLGMIRAFLSFFMLSLPALVMAGIIVTPASNGVGISADKSLQSTTTSFTPIGDIVLSEQQVQDFAFTDRYWRTMILTAPQGWEFKPSAGQALASAPSDFRVITMKVEPNTISLRFCVRSTEHLDVLTLSGIEVRSLNGMANGREAFIYRSAFNPGNALVSNITVTRNPYGFGGTNFASLSQRPGKVQKLVFAQKPTATEEGKLFDQNPELITVDQFGNFSTDGLKENVPVKIRLASGNGQLTGDQTMNIGMLGGMGRISYQGLSIQETGMKKLIATAPLLTFAVTNDFLVYQSGIETPVSKDLENFMCFRVAGFVTNQ